MRGSDPLDHDPAVQIKGLCRSNLGRSFLDRTARMDGGAGGSAGSVGGEPSSGGLPEFSQNMTWRPF